nr:hypothetical protein B0A51_17203 [Rachicladosporium sp. CCFEE 5018]
MDVAYDHIQEETLPSRSSTPNPSDPATSAPQASLNSEFQEAFKAVSASPWGARLGGWFGEARKQTEAFVSDLQKEATEAQEQASKGLEQLVQRTRGISLAGGDGTVPASDTLPTKVEEGGDVKSGDETEVERPESLPADIVKEAGTLVASFRSTAAAKLRDLQKAEDAADEALLKFGTNVRNFLRDAVVISAPDEDSDVKAKGSSKEVMFETTEQSTGRKVFHTTRFDAQLHAIHTAPGSFTGDPQGKEWETWREDFDIDEQTEAIAKDLEKYEELRRAMEKLVPEKVEYKTFWARYYFLRMAIEEDERRRKEVLKGAATDPTEEVAWDDDDEDEEEKSRTPQTVSHKASASTTTLHATDSATLQVPNSPRRSNEDETKSVAASDASYDLVSGATSRAPGSPTEEKKGSKEDSDDDWE